MGVVVPKVKLYKNNAPLFHQILDTIFHLRAKQYQPSGLHKFLLNSSKNTDSRLFTKFKKPRLYIKKMPCLSL